MLLIWSVVRSHLRAFLLSVAWLQVVVDIKRWFSRVILKMGLEPATLLGKERIRLSHAHACKPIILLGKMVYFVL